jgi:Ser/Thr protein kinase RdoA (MazF antagonist)
MRDFYQLTPRGRAQRLRRMALVALERFDLQVRRVRLVTNDFNGIFRVDAADGQTYILRVCLPEGGHSLAEIRSEMMWLAALDRDTDLGVPRPMPTRDGALVTTVEMAGVPQARHCVVFGWMPGSDLAERLTAENISRMGELAAQLHEHAGSFDPPQRFWLKTKDKVCPFGEPVVLFDAEHRDLFSKDDRLLFRTCFERVQQTIDALFATEQNPRVIHNDLHPWNVKVYRGRPYALDFEDLMWGFPAQDIAVTFYHLLGNEEVPDFRPAFRHGYTRHRGWPERKEGQLDTLIAGRGLMLANYVLQDPHPEWREQAPAFIERTAALLRSLDLGI